MNLALLRTVCKTPRIADGVTEFCGCAICGARLAPTISSSPFFEVHEGISCGVFEGFRFSDRERDRDRATHFWHFFQSGRGSAANKSM